MKRFKVAQRIMGVVGLALFVALAVIALSNSMAGSDYEYFAQLQDGGISGFWGWHLGQYPGRIMQGVFVTIGWVLGGAGAIKWMPVLLLACLALAMSWVAWRFLPLQIKSKSSAVCVGTMLTAIVVLLAPSLFDCYLWWANSSLFLPGAIVLVLTACMADIFVRDRPKGWRSAPIALLIVAGILLLVGPVIGRIMRGTEFGLWEILIGNPLSSLGVILESVRWWKVALVASGAILLSFMVKKPAIKLLKQITVGAVVATVGATYTALVVCTYVGGLGGHALMIPNLILIVGAMVLMAFVCARFIHVAVRQLLVAGCLIGAGVGLLGFVSHHVEFLTARNNAIVGRENSVRSQLGRETSEIRVVELPILIDNSATVDLSMREEERDEAFERSFRKYFRVPDDVPLLVLSSPNTYRALRDKDS